MSKTSIEWTDRTWNPVVGCSKVSPGCAHCYAETMGKRLRAMALADIAAGKDPGKKRHYIDAIDDKGRWTGKLIPAPESLADPLKRAEWAEDLLAHRTRELHDAKVMIENLKRELSEALQSGERRP